MGPLPDKGKLADQRQGTQYASAICHPVPKVRVPMHERQPLKELDGRRQRDKAQCNFESVSPTPSYQGQICQAEKHKQVFQLVTCAENGRLKLASERGQCQSDYEQQRWPENPASEGCERRWAKHG